jgi:hypothetical protein
MKTSLLVFPLLVNAVGVWAIWLRPMPPAIQSEIDSLDHGGVADHRAAPELGLVGERFQFNDPTRLRDRLRAAGFPPDLVNAIVVAQVRRKHQSRLLGSGLGAETRMTIGPGIRVRVAMTCGTICKSERRSINCGVTCWAMIMITARVAGLSCSVDWVRLRRAKWICSSGFKMIMANS